MLSWVKDTFKQSEAATVVQALLEQQHGMGLADFKPDKLASRLVAEAWSYQPQLFNGKSGERPDKLSVAAYALARGVDEFPKDQVMQLVCTLALGVALIEVVNNIYSYHKDGIDLFLLGFCARSYERYSQENTTMFDVLKSY